ncbi:MAG: divergent polysaccharide deacetylase family protein, partial [Rhodospirillaceae bacterium]|nr:divergent polysaccharide deacetylase family protein [Rhodospirillaceae bacterium]
PDPTEGEADSRIPKVVQNLEVLEAETAVLDQAIGRPTAPAGGVGSGSGEKSLNELVAGNAAPGSGVSFPATTKADFANLTPAPKGTPLKEAPNYEMVEEIDVGMIPRISDTGNTAFKEYSRPYDNPTSDRPRIAVIVSGLGQSRAATEASINSLPPEVTLAIDSYSRGIAYWIDRAREVGHEVLLTLPMESATFPFEDPGPGTLRVLDAPEENAKQIEWIMSRASGYFGLMGVFGSKFTTNQEQIASMIKTIKDRGLMFVDGGYTMETLVPRIAFKEQAIWAAVEMEIDTDLDESKIKQKLAELETLSQRRAITIARISPYPVSLSVLSEWIKTLGDKGIDLVPVSALANKQLVR